MVQKSLLGIHVALFLTLLIGNSDSLSMWSSYTSELLKQVNWLDL